MEITDYEIILRYDGLDAESHEIELNSLGISIQGFARIISTAAHFAITQQYSKKTTSQVVKVCATETKANCFTILGALTWVQQNQILSGSFGALLAALIPYILTKNANKKQEMKYLKESLDKAIEALGNKDRQTIDGLLKVIEKMADDLRPASRQAVEPIGNTCSTITVSTGKRCESKTPTIINEEDKAEINALTPDEITGMREFTIFITSLDKLKKTAKIYFLDDEPTDRTTAVIHDPLLEDVNNPYINAFDKNTPITIIGKAGVKGGDIVKIHVFDVVTD
ncbi:hypothetical protein ADP71_31520 [Vitreoscilla sp. C1]|uniref:DUF7946 domain-containing protein n=1 Tax=Vitreoscilla sp. (strain C1) TaxID=96942 RepID=UPI000CDC3CCE|nr:hypothetical protein [Vitreoscilla sp. C1]AUZ06330.1 hypothetical protein ADP71_31520 [Vitreoscilla sp. C1]